MIFGNVLDEVEAAFCQNCEIEYTAKMLISTIKPPKNQIHNLMLYDFLFTALGGGYKKDGYRTGSVQR